MNGIVVKFPQDSPAIVHISLGTMNVKYETKKSLTLFDTGGAHNGRTVAPEAILFESPCRANSETKMAKA